MCGGYPAFTIGRTEWAIIAVTSPVWIPLGILGFLGFGIVMTTKAAAHAAHKAEQAAASAAQVRLENAMAVVTRHHRNPKEVVEDMKKNYAEGRVFTALRTRDAQFYFQKGYRCEGHKDLKGAITEYREALRLQPNDVFAQIALARVLVASCTNDTLHEAIAMLRHLTTVDLEAEENQHEVHLPHGEIMMARIYPADVWCLLGSALYRDAVRDANEPDVILPFDLHMGNEYYTIRVHMATLREAHSAYLKACELDPEQIIAQRECGWIEVSLPLEVPVAKPYPFNGTECTYDAATDTLTLAMRNGYMTGHLYASPVDAWQCLKGKRRLEIAALLEGQVPHEALMEYQLPYTNSATNLLQSWVDTFNANGFRDYLGYCVPTDPATGATGKTNWGAVHITMRNEIRALLQLTQPIGGKPGPLALLAAAPTAPNAKPALHTLVEQVIFFWRLELTRAHPNRSWRTVTGEVFNAVNPRFIVAQAGEPYVQVELPYVPLNEELTERITSTDVA